MICEGIIFERDKLRILCHSHCYYRNPLDIEEETKVRREEDEWAAMETLGRLVVYKWPEVPEPWTDAQIVGTWQNYLMYLLKPVCRHYAVSDDTVLAMFMRHYLPSIIVSPKHVTPEGAESLLPKLLR